METQTATATFFEVRPVKIMPLPCCRPSMKIKLVKNNVMILSAGRGDSLLREHGGMRSVQVNTMHSIGFIGGLLLNKKWKISESGVQSFLLALK